jgi:hypothetical protein
VKQLDLIRDTELVDEAPPDPVDPTAGLPVIVAYGAGVDSTAMLVEMARRGWRPDLVLMADTGSEQPRTYAYLPIFERWLLEHGMPGITIVKNASPIAGDASLGDECHRKKVLPSLAYGGHSCSLKWKVGPQDRFCREHFGWDRKRDWGVPARGNTPPGKWKHGPWLLKLIGYDAGPADGRRIKNAAGLWPPGYVYRYPLHEWKWDRARCEAEIAAAGLPVPIKSSCYFCPAMKAHEVDALAKAHPELAAKAVEMERRAHERGLKTVKGLGRSWSWDGRLNPGPTPLEVFARQVA